MLHLADAVDPFLGCEPSDLPPRQGLAARWFFPKAQIGNNHPGACLPFEPMSVCPYTGGYPTGYGRYRENLSGQPQPRRNGYYVSGFTHFQHAGPGRIRKYYNYLRVTPHCGTLAGVGRRWALSNEQARPGYYACDLVGTGISAELTVAPDCAVHRYHFPTSEVALIAIDWSLGGLNENDKRSLPSSVDLEVVNRHQALGTVCFEGITLHVAIQCSLKADTYGAWFNCAPTDSTTLRLANIRSDSFKPFGCFFTGPTSAGSTVEVRVACSFHSVDHARAQLGATTDSFDAVAKRASERWREQLGAISVDGTTSDIHTQIASSLYRSQLKPALGGTQGPWTPGREYAFDFATLWDQYKTQLPLLYLLYPSIGGRCANGLLAMAEHLGRIPVCQLMASDHSLFANQASALGELTLAEACLKDVPGVNWDAALPLLERTITATETGQQFALEGIATPFTHHLDLCDAHAALAAAWSHRGVPTRSRVPLRKAALWPAAYDLETGLLDATRCYEGGIWNYSFRLQHDMAGRIALCGGEKSFIGLLDRFFGFGRDPVTQLDLPPFGDLWDKGVASCSFQGLNNEPDMESPYAYLYAGRHDRCCEVVRTVLRDNFTTGRGGLPGNDDSGALSSWHLFTSLGLFPVAGSDCYLIASPRVKHSRWQLPGGELHIDAPDANDDNIYVIGAEWNGTRLRRCWLHHHELAQGGHLRLRQG
ncbi:MAG: glycoside hydrolase family 92 protein, partial [Planctomycetota bacterium]|nr:glycoside hydrolase family 92 protein [Planctomycetota bacterium]